MFIYGNLENSISISILLAALILDCSNPAMTSCIKLSTGENIREWVVVSVHNKIISIQVVMKFSGDIPLK